MAKEKKTTTVKKQEETSSTCNDKICPIHGEQKLKLRGRIFKGKVVKKLSDRLVIEFERIIKVPKYERYEKRKTKIHARLPKCMAEGINVGDLVEVGETRPISKMIHAVVIKKVTKKIKGSKQ